MKWVVWLFLLSPFRRFLDLQKVGLCNTWCCSNLSAFTLRPLAKSKFIYIKPSEGEKTFPTKRGFSSEGTEKKKPQNIIRWNRPSFLVFAPIALALLLFILLGVRVAAAQAPTPSDDDVNAVARELYCPVCENIPLDVCPTTACAQWRELIRLKLSQGQSKEQIKQYFVAQYGDRVLAEPPRTGLNWLAYGLPPVIFLVGVYLVYRGMRGVIARRQKPAEAAPTMTGAPQEPPADPYLAQVEEELKRRE
jgi:cytochrome c-type biogenesis protein CcmH